MNSGMLHRQGVRLSVLGLACSVGVCASLRAAAQPATLTNAPQVLSLSAERAAQKLPVHVRGVVTAAEPTWNGKLFIQDETSGRPARSTAGARIG